MSEPKIIISLALTGGSLSGKRSFFIDEFEAWRAECGSSMRKFATRLNVSDVSYMRWTKGAPFNPAPIMFNKLMSDLHTHRVAIVKTVLGELENNSIYGGLDEEDPWYKKPYIAVYECPWCGSPRGSLTLQVNLHSRTFGCSYGKCPLNDPDAPDSLFNSVGDLLELPHRLEELRKVRGGAIATEQDAKVSIDTPDVKKLASKEEGLPVAFGDRLRAARKLRGLTQEALGKQLGCSRVAIYQWETERTIPKETYLLLLEKVLQVNLRSAIKRKRRKNNEVENAKF